VRVEADLLCIIEIEKPEDLIGPGAPPGTVPTDLEQATGLERLEILGKMQGVDVFDMRPLDASRKGTLGSIGFPKRSHWRFKSVLLMAGLQARSTTRLLSSLLVTSSMLAAPATLPIPMLRSGSPYVPLPEWADRTLCADVHGQMSRERPVERCPECGNVLKMEYVGPMDDPHDHGHDDHGHHHKHEDPKTFADFVRPEYH
jgi:cytochrome c oxidase subunit 5b